MKELSVQASVSELDHVLGFLEEELEGFGCSMKCSMQIQVAVEELFVNIANYAYPEGTAGTAVVRLDTSDDGSAVLITLTDSGRPFDPLQKADPDVTLSAEDRQIGGLGIFMARKSMDELRYEYTGGENHLTLIKKIR